MFLIPSLSAGAEDAENLYKQSQERLYRGELAGALDGFRIVWKEFSSARDSRAPQVGVFYGHVLAVMGEPEKAMTVLGPIAKGEDRLSLVARSAFAVCLRMTGEHKRAIKILKKLVEVYPRDSNDDLAQLARLHSELSSSYTYSRKFRESEAAAVEGVRIIYEAGERYAGFRASALIILSTAQFLTQKEEEATATLAKARDNLSGDSLRDAAMIEGVFGMLAYRHKRIEEAERRSRHALNTLTKLLGPDHFEVGAASKQLAIVLKAAKRDEEARNMEDRYEAILRRQTASAHAVSAWAWHEW